MSFYFKTALNLSAIASPGVHRNVPRLVTIGFSHYCEKARWALDLSPLQYYEEVHCPGLHLSTTLFQLSKLNRVRIWEDEHFANLLKNEYPDETTAVRKEQTSVPKLCLPINYAIKNNFGDKPVVVADGSSGIIKFLTTKYPKEIGYLYPSGELGKEIVEFEKYLDKTVGTAANKWAFGNLLLTGSKFDSNIQDSNYNKGSQAFVLSRVNRMKATPAIQRLIMNFAGEHIIPLMIKFNQVNAKVRDDALNDMKALLTKVDAMLDESEKKATDKSKVFIFPTEKLSAADITFAALTVPFLFPPETENLLTTLSDFEAQNPEKMPGCARIAAVAKELVRDHRSARHALNLYKNYRFTTSKPDGSIQKVTFKPRP